MWVYESRSSVYEIQINQYSENKKRSNYWKIGLSAITSEETIYGRAVADDSDVFETFSYGFNEYLPADGNSDTTLLSTDVMTGTPYQLVVTNSAGLYRYVTDHVVNIQGKHLDKLLFTIY